jgi:hypothetical protein
MPALFSVSLETAEISQCKSQTEPAVIVRISRKKLRTLLGTPLWPKIKGVFG